MSYSVALVYLIYCSRDLDHDPMTLIYEFHTDILKMYQQIKNELSMSTLSKVRA